MTSGLVSKLREEFSDSWKPTNKIDRTPDGVSFIVGEFAILHPVLDINAKAIIELPNSNSGQILDRHIEEITSPRVEGYIKGTREVRFEIIPEIFPESDWKYIFCVDNEVDTCGLVNEKEVISYLKSQLGNKKLSDCLDGFSLYDNYSEGGDLSRSKRGWNMELSKNPEGIKIENNFPEIIGNIPKIPKGLHPMLLELVLLQAGRSGFEIPIMYNIFKNLDINPIQKENFDARNNESSEIIFRDCVYPSWKGLAETDFSVFDTCFKLPDKIIKDEIFLTSVGKYAKRVEYQFPHFSPKTWQRTPCTKIKHSSGNYFAKQIDPAKVPSVDYELEISRKLRKKGFNVPEGQGIMTIQGFPYILFDYASNSVNLMGQDSSYETQEKLSQSMREQEKEIYSALGNYVKRMFDNGVSDGDMARRNFMVQFDESGKFSDIFQVDFEKTRIKRNTLTEKERAKPLSRLLEDLSESEKKYFMGAYKQNGK